MTDKLEYVDEFADDHSQNDEEDTYDDHIEGLRKLIVRRMQNGYHSKDLMIT